MHHRRKLQQRKAVKTCLLSAILVTLNGTETLLGQESPSPSTRLFPLPPGITGQTWSPPTYVQAGQMPDLPAPGNPSPRATESLIVDSTVSSYELSPSDQTQFAAADAQGSDSSWSSTPSFFGSSSPRTKEGGLISGGQSQPTYFVGQSGPVPLEHLGVPTVIEPSDDFELEPISPDDGRIKTIEPGNPKVHKVVDMFRRSTEQYHVYRSDGSGVTYLPGDGDQFGWLSFESENYLDRARTSGMTTNFNLHLLSGPTVTPLPPRLYDFELGYQLRNTLSDLFSYDCSAMVGIYSDFEDSARDGVRFPAHAVGMFHVGPRADLVFGVDYLDRDDIKVLPVGGLVWHDPARPQLRYELVFPRPRIDWTLSHSSRLYCGGGLGGGTWDIELPNESNDVMTYRDYRLVMGIERSNDSGGTWGWEAGWVFSRKLEFRSLAPDHSFDDAFVIRYVSRN